MPPCGVPWSVGSLLPDRLRRAPLGRGPRVVPDPGGHRARCHPGSQQTAAGIGKTGRPGRRDRASKLRRLAVSHGARTLACLSSASLSRRADRVPAQARHTRFGRLRYRVVFIARCSVEQPAPFRTLEKNVLKVALEPSHRPGPAKLARQELQTRQIRPRYPFAPPPSSPSTPPRGP